MSQNEQLAENLLTDEQICQMAINGEVNSHLLVKRLKEVDVVDEACFLAAVSGVVATAQAMIKKDVNNEQL